MATRRVILKIKTAFTKGKVAGPATEMKRYLKGFVGASVGTAPVRSGEPIVKPGQGAEKQTPLPDEAQGCLYSGGFLRGKPSTGRQEGSKQQDWINGMIQKWSAELASKNRRTNDGFRLSLNLLPHTLPDLTDSKLSSTQALISIWENAIELYRIRHGWEKPSKELGWICGARHDNAPLQIILFPTTKDGQPLKASDEGDEKNFTELIAMANVAAEIYWRDYLGFAYQDPDYQKAIGMVPMFEPPLPSYHAFRGGKSTIKAREKRREEPPKINAILIAQDRLSDTMISINSGSPLRRPTRQEIVRLMSIVAVKREFSDSSWLTNILLGKITSQKIKEVQEMLSDENEIIKGLIDDLGSSEHLPTRRIMEKIAKNKVELTFVALYLAVGIQERSSNEINLKVGAELATAYQTMSRPHSNEQIVSYWNYRGRFKAGSTKAKLRACSYRNALRAIPLKDADSRSSYSLQALICGAERIGHYLDSKYDDIGACFHYDGVNYRMNIQELEWSIEQGQMIRKKTQGVPWPPHFDPITVFETLKNQESKSQEPALDEAELEEPSQSTSTTGGVLERMIRITQPKQIERWQRVREIDQDV